MTTPAETNQIQIGAQLTNMKNWGQIPIDLIVHADSTCERMRYSFFSLSIDQRLVSVSPKPMLVF